MPTLLVSHPACLDHANPPGHPERPERLSAIARLLEAAAFADLVREEAPLAARDRLTLAHDPAYVDAIEQARPEGGIVALDADTTMSSGSWEAALRAAGAACHAVDAVMSGRVRNAFCAIRPPGHHAETSRAMGFCLFNNAAIAARHAQQAHGARRVAIMDFDVHHGNGTQDIFWDDATVLYASTHEMPLYPGTGAAGETGCGNIVNAPLHTGDGGPAFREAMRSRILPAIDAFAPDLLVISAGFDAHERDPLASLTLTEADFTYATKALMDLADTHCGGRIVSCLEGGYDLIGLARSAEAHVAALMRA